PLEPGDVAKRSAAVTEEVRSAKRGCLRQPSRYGLLIMSDSLNCGVALQTVTPAVLILLLALLSRLPYHCPSSRGRSGGEAVALGVKGACWLYLSPKPLRYCPP